MNAGMPGSAATRPSTKLKIVVLLPDLTAKQMAHGPAQVPRTASAAHASRQAAALGNPVSVGRSLPEPPDNNGRSELSKMRHDLFGEHFHVVDLAVESPASVLSQSREAPNSARSPIRSIQSLTLPARAKRSSPYS